MTLPRVTRPPDSARCWTPRAGAKATSHCPCTTAKLNFFPEPLHRCTRATPCYPWDTRVSAATRGGPNTTSTYLKFPPPAASTAHLWPKPKQCASLARCTNATVSTAVASNNGLGSSGPVPRPHSRAQGRHGRDVTMSTRRVLVCCLRLHILFHNFMTPPTKSY